MNSASRLARAAKCPPSVVLPEVTDYSAPAEDGLARHAFFEAAPAIGVEAALVAAPAHLRPVLRALSEHAVIRPLLAGPSLREVALAWDWLDGEGRVLPSKKHRDYSDLGPTEIPGTADRIALLDDETVVVHDYKGRERQAAAAEHTQLRFLGLAAASAYRRSRAVVVWIRIMDGDPITDSASFDAVDLADIGDEVRDIAERVESARGALANGQRATFARGPWCQRCEAFDACPAQHELLRVAVRTPEQLAQEFEVALTGGARGEAHRLVEQLDMLVRRLRERRDAHAAVRPIDLGEGKFYGIRPGRRQVGDAAKAREVLKGLGVEVGAAFTEELSVHATLGAIEKALRSALPAVREDAMRRLMAAGAVKQGSSLREYESHDKTSDFSDAKEIA